MPLNEKLANMLKNNFMTKLIFLLLIHLVASFSYASYAKERTSFEQKIIDQLILQPHRPSVQEVFNAFKGKMPEALRKNVNHPAQMDWRESILQYMPLAIAQLEYYYPGAIWAALGRDAAPIADLLEAFYISRGQRGRAVRIPASTGTFQYVNEELFIKMLQQLGMNLKSKKSRPFIILDRTSYRDSSQSTILISMIYDHYIGNSKSAAVVNRKYASLLTKAAVVTTAVATSEPRAEFFKRMLRDTSHDYPTEIIGVDFLSNFTDQTLQEWHGTFGKLKVYEHGRISGEVTNASGVEKRKLALEMMFEAYHVMKTKSFYEAVRREAKKLGYNFEDHFKTYNSAKTHAAENEEVEIEDPKAVADKAFDEGLRTLFADSNNVNESERDFAEMLKEKLKDIFIEQEGYDQKQALSKISAEKKQIKSTLGPYPIYARQYGYYNFSLLMMMYLRTLDPLDDSEERSYFSENASQINEVFVQHFAEAVAQYGPQYIRVLEAAVHGKLISARDYRRLVLFILAKVESSKNSKDFYLEVERLFKSNPMLKDVLTSRSEVYLTSPKYDKMGRKAYLRLIELGYLPKPEGCEEALVEKKKAG